MHYLCFLSLCGDMHLQFEIIEKLYCITEKNCRNILSKERILEFVGVIDWLALCSDWTGGRGAQLPVELLPVWELITQQLDLHLVFSQL